jgi:predicted nucleic acid-binding protein
MSAFFYDTWAFATLADRSEAHHAVSAEIDRTLLARGDAAVTTDYVLDEAVTLLQARAGAHTAITFLDLIDTRIAGANLMLVEVNAVRRTRAVETFRKLAQMEPRMSFTDCTSFVVMRELGIELAFTADRHFHRAGGKIRPLFELRRGRLTARL